MTKMVFITWKGKGWLVAPIVFGCALLTEIISEGITQNDNYYQDGPYPLSIALIIASLCLFLLHYILSKPAVESSTDKALHTPPKDNKLHSFFFIPVLYWAWIILVLSLIHILVSLFFSTAG